MSVGVGEGSSVKRAGGAEEQGWQLRQEEGSDGGGLEPKEQCVCF